MKVDREGGRPLDMKVKKLDINGFLGKQDWGSSNFIAPCIFHAFSDVEVNQENGSAASSDIVKVLHSLHYILLFIGRLNWLNRWTVRSSILFVFQVLFTNKEVFFCRHRHRIEEFL